MGFEAKIILHSEGPAGQELITTQFKYPRFIHAEFMTHREFSRNASSSRAIPVAKMIEQVRNDPAMPIHWGANQPGMQADGEISGLDKYGNNKKELIQKRWHEAARMAASFAQEFADHGLHKQVANRILEPYQWMHVICTTAKTGNFMGLRKHKDAQPEIKHLAEIWDEALSNSTPQKLALGEWHLPYITQDDVENVVSYLQVGRITRDMPRIEERFNLLAKLSAARCARVSYLTHDGRVPSMINDLELFDRLAGSQPIHASPLEHQACPDYYDPRDHDFYEGWSSPELHGNLPGWKQFRKMIAGEYIS